MKSILNVLMMTAALLVTMCLTYAFANETMLACPQTDGTILYTNKDVKGCKVVVGPALSIVPDRHAILIPQVPLIMKETSPVAPTTSRFSAGAPGAVLTETCAIWQEYVQLTERTAGGFERNSVDDVKRRYVLSRMFGSGFSPYGCQ